MGAYLEIYEGLFHQVLMIRQKKAKNKKLEKWEAEFYRNNRKLIDLKKQRSGTLTGRKGRTERAVWL